MLWIWVVLAVVAAWLLVAVLLALVIGRAARIGEVKYQDQVFLRRAARDSHTGSSVSSAA
jgi:hypothetical protein